MRRRWGDLSKQRFGFLTVLRYVPTSESGRLRGAWDCRCDCGKRLLVTTGNLVNRPNIACGCRRRKARVARTHEGRCLRCGEQFLGTRDQKFCSVVCRNIADGQRRRPKHHKVCLVCGTHFLGRKRALYCCHRCHDVAETRRRRAREHGTPAEQGFAVKVILATKGKATDEKPDTGTSARPASRPGKRARVRGRVR